MHFQFNLIKITLQQLVKYGAHQGYLRCYLNGQLKPYFLGFKGQIIFFNLLYAAIQFKFISIIISELVSLRHKILLVNHYQEEFNLLKSMWIKRCFLLEGHWQGGFLTNFKFIRLYTQYTKSKHPHLWTLSSPPSFIFYLNTTTDNWSIEEGLHSNIPLSVATGSSFNLLKKITYPIVASNETTEVLILYINLIQAAVWKGLLKEKSEVLRII